MPGPVQQFLSTSISKAAADLIIAVEALPEDVRAWKPLDKGRSALDQAAECAILNGFTANLIETKVFPSDFNYAEFEAKKAALTGSWETVKETLIANTAAVTAIVETVPDADLTIEIPMPWGTHTLAQVMAYPWWNMSYHEGQTNYISTLI